MNYHMYKGVCVCVYVRRITWIRTIGQNLGLTGGTEANVMENKERQTRAALVLELAHLCQQVQAAVKPQDHLLPAFPIRYVQEQLQPENGQVTETLIFSFRQCERQEVLQEVRLWINRKNIIFFLRLCIPSPSETN